MSFCSRNAQSQKEREEGGMDGSLISCSRNARPETRAVEIKQPHP